jgi:hypothetical protein
MSLAPAAGDNPETDANPRKRKLDFIANFNQNRAASTTSGRCVTLVLLVSHTDICAPAQASDVGGAWGVCVTFRLVIFAV